MSSSLRNTARRTLLVLAAAAVAAPALTACSNATPFEPTASATTARASHSGGFIVVWGGKDSTNTSGASANGGFAVGWGVADTASTETAQGGFAVGWGVTGEQGGN